MSQQIAIGVMAHNEELNIGRLLESLLCQTAGARIARIVVVASGCTDRTCEIVQQYCSRDSRVELIAEPVRAGKVLAVNEFLRRVHQPILIVSGADLVFEPGTVEAIVAPFERRHVGMVGAHPVPVNNPDTFFGYAARLMWNLHHDISLADPKMGEMIAFRNVFAGLNPSAINDELSIQYEIHLAGYGVAYAPDAVVRNRGPESVSDFVSQRTHCLVANMQVMRDHRLHVSTMPALTVLKVALKYAARDWSRLHWIATIAGLELYCRIKSKMDYASWRARSRYRVWKPVTSTKAVVQQPSTEALR